MNQQNNDNKQALGLKEVKTQPLAIDVLDDSDGVAIENRCSRVLKKLFLGL